MLARISYALRLLIGKGAHGDDSRSPTTGVLALNQPPFEEEDLASDSTLQQDVAEPRSLLADSPHQELDYTVSMTLPAGKRPVSTHDPYSGYHNQPQAVNRRKKRKQRKTLVDPVMIDGRVVSYSFDTIPGDMKKYYAQRYHYFSKFDQGILMDLEGWFSVTPEAIAKCIAERCRCNVIIDAFAGCGGNAIQFAMTCEQVIAIDLDPVRLQCAYHNAKIYGVADRIQFIQGDFFEVVPKLKADVVFLSPPWGGPSYCQEPEFNVKTMIPGDGVRIFEIASAITPNVAYYLPRNTSPQQLAALAGPGGVCEIQRNVIGAKLKAVTSYYGNLVDWQAYPADDVSHDMAENDGYHVDVENDIY